MNKLNGAVLLFVGLMLASKPVSANVDVTLDQSLSDITKGNIASAIVLSDAGLVTLGVVNFDPNNIIDLDGVDAGSAESVQRRKELNVYSIPWESDWLGEPESWQTASFIKFSYINSKQSIQISERENQIDKLSEESYLLFGEQRWKYQLNQDWWLQFGLGAHLVWYDNDFAYSDDTAEYRELLDGNLFNTSFGAWMIDPSIQLHYQNTLWGNQWQYISRFSYAFGDIIKTDSDFQSGSPNVGRFSNTFIYHYPLPELMAYKNEMRFLFKRIDLSGDAVDTMGTSHYYETGLGWIVETPSLSSWLTNVGIGVTVNIDSALSGGSVVLLFNEDI
ncbi:Solitary outer membrane autotransporter beta-barrel domain [Shewanella olleyana]|uniref:Solitary outer membrane autotransporter beta-barrel domain n=1 Tax=Shewanella olleyana TaxID=135626 RepID=UPI00200D9A19|nr:Solitary outer membrane autotransporter beta-barrel domain [Shewanella olleyana]MCL1067710.1 Solitary outer membrane autotransporter beta-barrel domain [Shewanella olleyana]